MAGMTKEQYQKYLQNVPKIWAKPSLGQELNRYGPMSKASILSGRDRQPKISPQEFSEYEPNRPTDRLPTYKEFSGQEPKLNTGQWGDVRKANLGSALQNYDTNYEGSRVGASQYGYEAGVVGLPQDLGQNYLQEFYAIAEEKALGIKEGEDALKVENNFKALLQRFPGANLLIDDTPEEMEAKIAEWKQSQDYREQTDMSNIAITLDDAVYQATLAEEPVSVDDVITTGMQLGFQLTFDEAQSIFNSAVERARRAKEAQNNG